MKAKSRVVYYEVELQQIYPSDVSNHFDKERRVKQCLALGHELCSDISLFGPILRTILHELESGIFSDEIIARNFFGCGVFSDTSTVQDIQARTTFHDIPCFLLLDIANEERTDILHERAKLYELQQDIKNKHDQLVSNERMLRREMYLAKGDLQDSQYATSEVKIAYKSLHAEAIQQQRDMAASTLSLQREMQAMRAAITQYQSDIRDLQRDRAAALALKKDFERIRCKDEPQKLGVSKDVFQALQTQMQLLLLRNTCLQEYEHEIQVCSPEMRSRFRKQFVLDVSGILDEYAALESYTKELLTESVDASKVPQPMQPLLGDGEFPPENLMWAPFRQWCDQPLPKCIPILSLDKLEIFFAHVWQTISATELKWEKLSQEHERDKDKPAEAISEVLSLAQVCIEFVDDRYGERRAAVLALASILKAIDEHVESSPQLELFGSVFAGELDQSAWWYFMRVKTYVAQLEIEITSPDSLRQVGQYLLPKGGVHAINDDTLNPFVASVHMNMKGELTSTKFFDWLATRIMIADELHFREAKHILLRNESSHVKELTQVQFSKNVLDCVHLSRSLLGRYFRAMSGPESKETNSNAVVSINKVVYMLAYIQLARRGCSS